jgi:hypothetical protein
MSLILAFLRLFVNRVRRNHALEHATIHILTQRNPYISLIGYSDWKGFHIYGQVTPEELQAAAEEALRRLRAGERHLAIHPRCGTVLATMGILGGLSAFLVMGLSRSRSRFRWSSLPDVLTATTAGVVAGQPLGLLLQQHLTTSADMGDLRIVRIFRQGGTSLPALRVETS